ncbi:hypothetical protein NCCP2331_16290 [Sporosarcina sp. NCCP-2331]|nr:hypothetical protein NCCP2331_16290 [Sporosarcina sp. NCCP-2331]GLB55600.1 hypothetical protein NCCP2378_13870 [Sporosarcina sp. NCCP-2378]
MCKYCTPDKHGRRLPLDTEEFPLNHSMPKIKRNILKIYRQPNNKKQYFIGISSKDWSADGKLMYRNNGFTMKRYIKFCPMCGRDLALPIN